MSEQIFHGFSFFSGVFTGFVLRWTDFVPVLGGFLFGFSMRRMPNLINLESVPKWIKDFCLEKSQEIGRILT